jgi:hypothetical protein
MTTKGDVAAKRVAAVNFNGLQAYLILFVRYT